MKRSVNDDQLRWGAHGIDRKLMTTQSVMGKKNSPRTAFVATVLEAITRMRNAKVAVMASIMAWYGHGLGQTSVQRGGTNTNGT